MSRQSQKRKEEIEAAPLVEDEAISDQAVGVDLSADEPAAGGPSIEDDAAPHIVQSLAERMAIIEALIFVSDEPLATKTIAEVMKEDRAAVEAATIDLAQEFNARNGGLQLREVGGGWQFATR